MAGIFNHDYSPLLCDESKDFCFDDLDDDHNHHHDHHDSLESNNLGQSLIYEIKSQPLMLLPEQSDEVYASMVEREREYLPREDYLTRLRSGELDLSVRGEAFDWIFKAHSYYSFGPLSFCLAVNYLDRFLSTRELPTGQAWAVQLLAVACLSIAAKIEETSVPPSVELQVGDPKYVFEAKAIQRMELLVLDALNWRMNAVTPCSLLELTLKKLCDAHYDSNYLSSSSNVVNRSMQLISCTIKGIDSLEFRPSEIAAAVAMSITAEIQVVDIDKSSSCFIPLDKGRVMKCVKMIKDKNSGINRSGGSVIGVVPQSPIGVLEAGCFSYKSDECTTVVGSYANSSLITRSPETKRKKLDTASSSSKLDS